MPEHAPDPRKPTPEELTAAIDRLFPVDGTSHTARVLGMQKRSVDRMSTGYSSCPPRIIDKLNSQADLKDRWATALEALVQEGLAAGIHPLVVRYTVYDLVKSGRFDGEHDPI